VLETIQKKQVEDIATGNLDLGAPVLDFEQDSEPIVSDGVVTAVGFTPMILTPTITNSGADYARFVNNKGDVPENTMQELRETINAVRHFNPQIEIVEEEIVV